MNCCEDFLIKEQIFKNGKTITYCHLENIKANYLKMLTKDI